MKAKIIGALVVLTVFIDCSKRNKIHSPPSVDHIVAIDAELPFRLDKADLDHDGVTLSDEINARIKRQVEEYYQKECIVNSQHSYKETYVNTIRFYQKQFTAFLVLVKHFPGEWLSAKVLFYDNEKKEFVDGEFDFKIFATYDFDNGRIIPSRLKTKLNLNSPEIELVDYDKNGTNDFKFLRLHRSGVIQVTIVSVSNHKIDILYDEELRKSDLMK